ncbi:MAG: ion transporter [Dokdonella sp.]
MRITKIRHGHSPARRTGWRAKTFYIVFGHESRAGRGFDIGLIVVIAASVLVTMLDSVAALHLNHVELFLALEWFFTIIFSVEYILRLSIVAEPRRYARSFYGVIDLLAVLPTYLSLLLPGAQYLLVIRALRILRIFRVLKMARYVGESQQLVDGLLRSRRKIFIFVSTVVTLVIIFGALMYLIEGPRHGFTSIPRAMYWAVVTMGTVGFGDMTPGTPLGQFVTSIVILIGYGIIAVPTGIYAAELNSIMRVARSEQRCGVCGRAGHELDADFCRYCGAALNTTTTVTAS